jgi:hypothetical protein
MHGLLRSMDSANATSKLALAYEPSLSAPLWYLTTYST